MISTPTQSKPTTEQKSESLTSQKKQALSYADRVTIAGVLTWDAMGTTFSPDDIEAIRIEGDMVWVRLTRGSWPISRHMFRNILEAQRAAINKQIEQIIEIEAQEVIEAELQMSEIIHAAATQEFYSEHLGIDTLPTEPINRVSEKKGGGNDKQTRGRGDAETRRIEIPPKISFTPINTNPNSPIAISAQCDSLTSEQKQGVATILTEYSNLYY